MESQATKNKRALTKKTFEVHFDLDNTNYEAVENIGSGAYGVVCSAKNKLNKEKVNKSSGLESNWLSGTSITS